MFGRSPCSPAAYAQALVIALQPAGPRQLPPSTGLSLLHRWSVRRAFVPPALCSATPVAQLRLCRCSPPRLTGRSRRTSAGMALGPRSAAGLCCASRAKRHPGFGPLSSNVRRHMRQSATPLVLTKFDVAERQLNQAVLMFFDEQDPVSVHTLAEAAAQVLYDIRALTGASSIGRDSDLIRPEYKKEWLALLFSSRNFFKHADRDSDATHTFKEEFNHYSLFDAVNMYLSAKKAWTPESMIYVAWFVTMYPQTVKEGTDFEAVVSRFRSGPQSLDTGDRSLFAKGIRAMRSGVMPVPGVSLDLGLPK
jgi:hypothetical protein